MKTISQQLTDWWEANGYSFESTKSFFEEIESQLSDQAISVSIELDEDGNDYD